MAVDMEVVRALLEDGGKVPESEDGNGLITSDVPWFWGASVIGMVNSSLVIGLGVSNTGGGMLLRSWLVNEGVMVHSSARPLVHSYACLLVRLSAPMLIRSSTCPLLRSIPCPRVCLSTRVVVRLSACPLVCSFARMLVGLFAPTLVQWFACLLDAAGCWESSSYNTIRWLAKSERNDKDKG